MDPFSSYFGACDADTEQWHVLNQCECKQLSQSLVDFLHCTIGLEGYLHDTHGYVLKHAIWQAFVEYARWRTEQKLDLDFHIQQVLACDDYYIRLVSTKMHELET